MPSNTGSYRLSGTATATGFVALVLPMLPPIAPSLGSPSSASSPFPYPYRVIGMVMIGFVRVSSRSANPGRVHLDSPACRLTNPGERPVRGELGLVAAGEGSLVAGRTAYRPGRGILRGVPAFSCTALCEERYFCYPFDRCGLGPVSRKVLPRSGMDPSPPSGPSRVFSQAGPLQHHIRRPAFALPLASLPTP